ncbi:MAG: UvrB/UvrC motif-containing protein [Halanaerobium sp.]
MLCERCGDNEASVHLTRIINGRKEEIHLCENCARNNNELNIDDNNLSFQSLLSGILNHDFSNEESSVYGDNDSQQLVCSNCGMSYKEFTEKGFFGCEHCFSVFEDRLDALFKKIHGNIRHNGKSSFSFQQELEVKSEINDLKKEMRSAVEKENFEKAAEIRDKIHAITENMEEKKDES